jgi:hypothetical protein
MATSTANNTIRYSVVAYWGEGGMGPAAFAKPFNYWTSVLDCPIILQRILIGLPLFFLFLSFWCSACSGSSIFFEPELKCPSYLLRDLRWSSIFTVW